jgi:hypothetical protein
VTSRISLSILFPHCGGDVGICGEGWGSSCRLQYPRWLSLWLVMLIKLEKGGVQLSPSDMQTTMRKREIGVVFPR